METPVKCFVVWLSTFCVYTCARLDLEPVCLNRADKLTENAGAAQRHPRGSVVL